MDEALRANGSRLGHCLVEALCFHTVRLIVAVPHL